MKRFLTVIIIAIMSLLMTFTTGCSDSKKCESTLKKLSSAKSFTASFEDGLLKVSDSEVYWKVRYGKNFTEYYFTFSGNDKNFVYTCESDSDKWGKFILSNSRYLEYVAMLKEGLGVSDYFCLTTLGLISLNFDQMTTNVGNTFRLKNSTAEDMFSQIWLEDSVLCLVVYGDEVQISDVNKTKVKIKRRKF